MVVELQLRLAAHRNVLHLLRFCTGMSIKKRRLIVVVVSCYCSLALLLLGGRIGTCATVHTATLQR